MLTLKQTDIRDIAVNYSTYSQDFTPASANNNKILFGLQKMIHNK
jgi:hypothetical protein